MVTHSSVLAWRLPGMGEPGGLCLWGRTESDTTEATYQQQQQQRDFTCAQEQGKDMANCFFEISQSLICKAQ